jgi:hypothetical protein
LYTVIGDLNNDGMLQNFRDIPPPDASFLILKVNATAVEQQPVGSSSALSAVITNGRILILENIITCCYF